MGRITDRLFWSEDGQARTDQRFRRARTRGRQQIWVSLKLRWVMPLLTIAAVIVGAATPETGHPFGSRDLPYKIVAMSLLLIVVLIPVANRLIVHRRLANGWRPVIGVHTLARDDEHT